MKRAKLNYLDVEHYESGKCEMRVGSRKHFLIVH